MKRFAKIVATLGPASSSDAVLRLLIQAGVDVARLNFSHGTHRSHAELIKKIRQLSSELNKPVTILQDLQGPKLRVGILPEEGLTLEARQRIMLKRISEGEEMPLELEGITLVPLDVPALARAVSIGQHILLDDGHLELAITDVRDKTVEAEVVLGGKLTSNKGVNLPGLRLDIPSFTEKDREDLTFGMEQGVDAVAISFVRSARDVEAVRQAIEDTDPYQSNLPIIAKLEHPDALANLEEIIQASDGVMVARGDMAVETTPATVPVMQKRIIATANRENRVVITATQMLESMIYNPRPTRAEASDVANAIFDGSDALMLSAETAIGKYPVESVAMMDEIVHQAETHLSEWGASLSPIDESTDDDAISVTRAARELVRARRVSSAAVFTRTGRTALLMSKARPGVPILAFTPEQRTFQRLGLYHGVIPHLVPYADDVETMLESVEAAVLESALLSTGQQVVVVSGFPVSEIRLPNFALLHTIESRNSS